MPRRGRSITVGSDCCGYGSDLIALKLLNVPFKLMFTAEKDAGKRELLAAVHPGLHEREGVVIYEDITQRNNETAPYVDIFCTGAPCPAFSHAGKRGGTKDSRGLVIFSSIHYVVLQRPRLVLIENVEGLKTGNMKEHFENIVGIMANVGYEVEHQVLNTKSHGIPHSRPRLYIVGIQKKALKSSMQWPEPISLGKIERFLDQDLKPSEDKARTKSHIIEANLKLAQEKWNTKFNSEFVFVDVFASAKFAHSALNVCPCITRSRGQPDA